MNKAVAHGIRLLTLLVVATSFIGCNNEDDVIEIFTGNTWKMTYIAAEGSHRQFDFWGGDESARETSMDELAKEGNFTLTFVGTDLSETTGGEFSGRGIQSSVSGEWSANGETHDLSLGNVKTSRNETDALGRAFITGLNNAYRYGGDNQNLYIYYKDNNTVKFMAFRPAN